MSEGREGPRAGDMDYCSEVLQVLSVGLRWSKGRMAGDLSVDGGEVRQVEGY